jgi:hypothetical protein
LETAETRAQSLPPQADFAVVAANLVAGFRDVGNRQFITAAGYKLRVVYSPA